MPAAETSASPGAGGWARAAALAVLASLVALALFWPTAWSMVETWSRSETFTHGFLVVPISLWLVWHRRQHLAAVVPAFSWLGFVALLAAGLAWLAGYLADALVVAQFGLVGMLVGAVWAILGNQAARELVFALGFLFFAVPVGEALVPPLMDFTASFTVGLLRLTGIPVYREGLFFSVPSGNWSVIETCSGIRYIIASVTLGVLYAYLAYQTTWRRVVFILASALVPVIANGLRAYSIVMIAHLSDMKLATGVDHLLWGWFFFGIVMLIVFSIGAIWREPEIAPRAPAVGSAIAVHGTGVALGAVAVLATLVLLRLGTDQIAAHQSLVRTPTALPATIGGWVKEEHRPWSWLPMFLPAELGSSVTYRKDDLVLTVDVAHFVQQRQDAEAINTQNRLAPSKDSPWRVYGRGAERFATADGDLPVEAFWLRGPQSLAVWRWYRIGSRYTTNPYLAKLYQAFDRLTLDRTDGAIVIVAAPLDARDQPPEAALQAFVRDFVPALSAALDASVGE
jgi:exosortase A